MSEGRVLAYEDVVLYEEDVDTLDGHCWLTDNVVSFAASYLHNHVLREELREKVGLLTLSNDWKSLYKHLIPGADRVWSSVGADQEHPSW